MKKHFCAFTSVVLFSLAPSMVLAQAMPDEVDHVRYRATLDGLQNRLNDARELLASKQAERDRLTAEITNMNRDRQELPARNADLSRNIGDMQARISALEAEIRSLSTTIDRVAQDLRNIDAQVQQLRQNWTQEENQRLNLANRLQAIRQDVRRMSDQLDREVGEERESMAVLDRAEKELQALDSRRMNVQDQHVTNVTNATFRKFVAKKTRTKLCFNAPRPKFLLPKQVLCRRKQSSHSVKPLLLKRLSPSLLSNSVSLALAVKCNRLKAS
jgi:septal ring factor EnvC (AmiA/AmiB activator)